MTKVLIMAATLTAISGVPTAHADFQLAGQGRPNALPVSNPVGAAGEANAANTGQAKPAAPHVAHPRIANGFGTQIPLAFAVKQVVPATVKTSYARDIDADAITVDWQGGRPWPDVLRSMLKGSDLQVTFSRSGVLIERQTPS